YVTENPHILIDYKETGASVILAGSGYCKWFNVRMGFGFISMTSSEGKPVDPPLDVFVHQSKLVMEGFRSLREGEQVEFTFKRSSKGLESLRVTGPGGGPCSGSDRRPKGKFNKFCLDFSGPNWIMFSYSQFISCSIHSA
uniref:Lin-28 homolog B (C. elegans) n=1 Tax=Sinocyclocheilus grahami TaxID=75366 RepID=A0A672T7R1_SINGR